MKKLFAQSLLPLALAFVVCAQATPTIRADEPKEEQKKEDDGNSLARRWLERLTGRGNGAENQRNHDTIVNAFSEVVRDVRESTVIVYSNNRVSSLGAVVDSQGFVITKASELKDELECKLPNGSKVAAVITGIDRDNDLAMLKIEANGLVPVRWREGDSPDVGSWLITASPSDEPHAIGVVSVAPRKLDAPSGILGIMLDQDDKGPRINQVLPDSGAEKAGLQVNDIVTMIEDKKVKTREELISEVKEYRPGETIRLSVLRGDKVIAVNATLGNRTGFDNAGKRRDFQNSLGTSLSRRRNGFPNVLQHDTVLRPADCGGPVVDIEGRVVGINIARANRVSSFLVPTSVIVPLIEKLKGVGASPDLTIKQRLDELQKTLVTLKASEASLLERFEIMTKALEAARSAEESAQAAADAANSQLKNATNARTEAEKQTEAARKELDAARKQIESIETEKTSIEEKLATRG